MSSAPIIYPPKIPVSPFVVSIAPGPPAEKYQTKIEIATAAKHMIGTNWSFKLLLVKIPKIRKKSQDYG